MALSSTKPWRDALLLILVCVHLARCATITSVSAPAVMQIGQTYTISWTGGDSSTSSYVYISTSATLLPILLSASAVTGSTFSWTVSAVYPPGLSYSFGVSQSPLLGTGLTYSNSVQFTNSAVSSASETGGSNPPASTTGEIISSTSTSDGTPSSTSTSQETPPSISTSQEITSSTSTSVETISIISPSGESTSSPSTATTAKVTFTSALIDPSSTAGVTATSGSHTTKTSTPSTTSKTSTTSSSTSTPAEQHGLSAGGKAAIAIGIIFGIAGVAAAAFIFGRRVTHQRSDPHSEAQRTIFGGFLPRGSLAGASKKHMSGAIPKARVDSVDRPVTFGLSRSGEMLPMVVDEGRNSDESTIGQLRIPPNELPPLITAGRTENPITQGSYPSVYTQATHPDVRAELPPDHVLHEMA